MNDMAVAQPINGSRDATVAGPRNIPLEAHVPDIFAAPRLLGAVFDAIGGALRPVLTPVIRWGKRRATREALMRCSDRVLADIGVERADIPLVAKSVVPVEHQPALRRWWASARARWAAARAARRKRRQVYRELDAYSHRELDEIGLRRGDVPAVAREHEKLRRAA